MKCFRAFLTNLLLVAALGVGVLDVRLNAQEGGNGSLTVKSKPGRAGVFVDGKYLGPASNMGRSRTYSLPAGEHELILREPRYQDSKTSVRIEAGEKTTVSRTLEARKLAIPPFGTLRIVGYEKFAAVYVNELFAGHADEFNARGQGLLLNPAEYDLRVVSPNGSVLLERKVTIVEGNTEIVRK
jgi:hypothetical protein